jgi:predicted RNA-binding protein Jag
METMKVKPWGNGQGDHVVINKADFDPKKHEELKDSAVKAAEPVPASKEQAKETPAKAKKAKGK